MDKVITLKHARIRLLGVTLQTIDARNGLKKKADVPTTVQRLEELARSLERLGLELKTMREDQEGTPDN